MDLLAGKRAPAEGGQIRAEADIRIGFEGMPHERILTKAGAVSYTHLTLPTKRIV